MARLICKILILMLKCNCRLKTATGLKGMHCQTQKSRLWDRKSHGRDKLRALAISEIRLKKQQFLQLTRLQKPKTNRLWLLKQWKRQKECLWWLKKWNRFSSLLQNVLNRVIYIHFKLYFLIPLLLLYHFLYHRKTVYLILLSVVFIFFKCRKLVIHLLFCSYCSRKWWNHSVGIGLLLYMCRVIDRCSGKFVNELLGCFDFRDDVKLIYPLLFVVLTSKGCQEIAYGPLFSDICELVNC